MPHIVLLGDSIFDNAAYVAGGPDVVAQLRAILPDGWAATLCAVDGAVTGSVPAQLARVPKTATHLVLSVGGNDALGASHLLGAPVRNVGEGVGLLAAAQDAFERNYNAMLDQVVALGLPTAICTIYDTPTSAPDHRIIKSALSLFNDRITRAAFRRGLSVVDLRLICDEDGDYANPIEPSVQGGDKMARAIFALVSGGAGRQRSLVIAALN
jgi:hypothetical protein